MKYLSTLLCGCFFVLIAETAHGACTSYEDFGSGTLTQGIVEAMSIGRMGGSADVTVKLSEGYRDGAHVSCVQFTMSMGDDADRYLLSSLQMAMAFGYGISIDLDNSFGYMHSYNTLTIAK